MSIFGQGQLHKEEKDRFSLRANASQNYFQDFEVKQIVEPNGKTKSLWVYKGVYHVMPGTDRDWKRRKVTVGGLSLLSAALYFGGILVNTPGNLTANVSYFTMASLLSLLYVAYALISYLPAPHKMTTGIFRTVSKPLRRAAFLAAVTMAVGFVIRLMAALNTPGDLPAGIFCALAILAAAGVLAYLWLSEKRIPYETQASDPEEELADGVEDQAPETVLDYCE